jgi:outer membrane protein assembly factor BamE (lipoprotein component of BamABCDE complex)
MKIVFLPVIACLTLSACISAGEHRDAVQDDQVGRLTLGSVQHKITVGMSGAEVLTIMGSPNIVSTNRERNEVWVYDKISSDVSYSSSAGGIFALVIGAGGDVGGAGGGGADYKSGAKSRSQKTLTVIIRFDGEQRVEDFAYHVTRF